MDLSQRWTNEPNYLDLTTKYLSQMDLTTSFFGKLNLSIKTFTNGWFTVPVPQIYIFILFVSTSIFFEGVYSLWVSLMIVI